VVPLNDKSVVLGFTIIWKLAVKDGDKFVCLLIRGAPIWVKEMLTWAVDSCEWSASLSRLIVSEKYKCG
jgi:hypothetical protein